MTGLKREACLIDGTWVTSSSWSDVTDPATGAMEDLGVLAVKNADFFDFAAGPQKNPDGSSRPIHGYHTLPDGTLTPLHVIMALIVARDGTLYATTIYPFTLLKVESLKAAHQ